MEKSVTFALHKSLSYKVRGLKSYKILFQGISDFITNVITSKIISIFRINLLIYSK